ncbi:DUF6508 domain-containing protein [Methylobacterium iners]|uniref:Uncharacterized protein n=1 Tax=Methylobacterium iners TaxID=418707 RepID=A0ABQ4S062_9HYPH|nr:DUF6508 domain-containing protein [Methylobacterium iners]GJD96241.1 hypothetical protein OCOJLMKI_3461 [Methylobacterium iners]
MEETPERRSARLAAIVRYIPTFADPAVPVGMWHQPESKPGCIEAAWFAMDETAARFVADCYDHGWVVAESDWAGWAQTERAKALRDDPAVLASATEQELAQLLTVVIRQDRFCEGSVAGAFESGMILGVLRRLEQLTLTSWSNPVVFSNIIKRFRVLVN